MRWTVELLGKLKDYLKNTRKNEEEKTMVQKPTVQVIAGDSPKPTKNQRNSIDLNMPFPLTLQPGQPYTLRLGVKTDTNLLVGSYKMDLTKTLFLVGQEVVLQGIATVTAPTPLEVGERIAVAIPLVPDFDIEVE